VPAKPGFAIEAGFSFFFPSVASLPGLFKVGWVKLAQVQGVSAQAAHGAGNRLSWLESFSGER